MRVIVTGGAGFIGSHVVEKLIDSGYKVAIVDHLCSTKNHYIHPEASFYQVDIGSDDLYDVFAAERPDYVIHLAAQVDVGQSLVNPVQDANVNISGTIHVMQCLRRFPVRKIVLASSAAVYGEPIQLPIEETHPVTPNSFYGLSKYVAEIYVRLFSSTFGIDYAILRYANVYGPRQDPVGEAGVVSIFANQLLSGGNLVIFGDGRQTRDFVYVEDVAIASVMALVRGKMDVFNISCNHRTSLLELVDVMSNTVDRKITPIFKNARPGDIIHSSLANQKAQRILGWSPRINLHTGLERTIRHHQEHLCNC